MKTMGKTPYATVILGLVPRIHRVGREFGSKYWQEASTSATVACRDDDLSTLNHGSAGRARG